MLMLQEEGRLRFEEYAKYLISEGKQAYIAEDKNGNYLLEVLVEGPMEKYAQFQLSYANDSGSELLLYAMYSSDIIKEGNIRKWAFAANTPVEDICGGIVKMFLEECFDLEHEKFVEIEIINNDNLDEFAVFLDDRALTEDGVYAVGIRVRDDEEMETAGAASFSLDGDTVVIENVTLLPQYEEEYAIEEYVANYIYDRIAQADIDLA